MLSTSCHFWFDTLSDIDHLLCHSFIKKPSYKREYRMMSNICDKINKMHMVGSSRSSGSDFSSDNSAPHQ